MNNKLIRLVMVLGLAIGLSSTLVACGGGDTTTTDPAVTPTVNPTPTTAP